MNTPKTDTPLAEWLRKATPDERTRMATLAGTTVSYLYQLAGGHRGVPKSDLAFSIEDATFVLNKYTGGRLPVITARELATMAAVSGLGVE